MITARGAGKNTKNKLMKKMYTVKAYEAYDCTDDWRLGDLFKTIFEAAEKCRFSDLESRERWQQSRWYNHGRVNPFEHHDYAVIELVGTAELEVEDDDYEPSFYELCEAVENWQDGEYFKKYEFED